MIIWYGLTAIGIAAVVVALLRPPVRRPALLVGAAVFGVAGALSIQSFGAAFLVAAIVCGVLAWRHSPGTATEEPATT